MRMKIAVLGSSLAVSISTILFAKTPTMCVGSYYVPGLHPVVNMSGPFSAMHMAFYGAAFVAMHLLYKAKRGSAKKAAICIAMR